jgi:alkylhydroperoxidase family enzyme
MEPMFLSEVEASEPAGLRAEVIHRLREQGAPVPQILHLLSYKPDRTDHLARFTHAVLRGPSPLPPGLRELIAAFTSRRNACPF